MTNKILSLILLSVFLLSSCKDSNKKSISNEPVVDQPKTSIDRNNNNEEVNNMAFKEWAKNPPMGWNSWDCYGPTVTEKEVKANTDYMAEYLKPHGWEYIVVDIRWFVENTKAGGYNQTDPNYVLDDYGRYLPAKNKFPSAKNGQGFKPLADYIHGKGLKFGIHIMRGIPTKAVEQKLPIKGTNGITAQDIYSTENQCKWLRDNYTILADRPGAQEYYNSILNLYASWGVDFIKVDDLSAPIYHEKEIELIRNAIDQTGRKIVLSTSPGETPIVAAEHVSDHANMWRMVNDVWDEWHHIKHLIGVSQDWYPYIGSGTWPDCDMIPLGRISVRGERGADRMSRLTHDEQYTLMNFFTIFKSPLFFGGDLPSNDPFTLSLLTNDAVLKMHKESTAVKKLFQTENQLAITSTNKNTGGIYLALFNIGDSKKESLTVTFDQLGVNKNGLKRTNLWTNKSEKLDGVSIQTTLAPHQSVLLSIGQE